MDRSRFKRLSILGQVGAWLAFFLVVFITEASYEGIGYGLVFAGLEVLFQVIPVYVHYFLLLPLLQKGKKWSYAIQTFGLIGINVMVYYMINDMIPSVYDSDSEDGSGLAWYFYSFLLSLILLGVSSLYYFVESWFDHQERESKLRNEKLQAELNFLKSQINPHFLFNTLNNIYAFAQTGNENTAPMIERLASILRYIVYDCQADLVPLEKEIQAVEDMLALYRVKNSAQQNFKLKIDQVKAYHRMAPLILISLVENAFKHGDAISNPGGFMHIEISVESGNICTIKVANSVKKNGSVKLQPGGLGLENVKKRLQLQYEAAYSLEEVKDEGQYSIEIQIPLSRKQ